MQNMENAGRHFFPRPGRGRIAGLAVSAACFALGACGGGSQSGADDDSGAKVDCSSDGLDTGGGAQAIECATPPSPTLTYPDCSTAQTLSADIESDLALLEGCHKLTDRVAVRNDATLTIEAGAYLVFESGASLDVVDGGSIQATGTSNKKVVFTGSSKTPGAWGGIRFDSDTLGGNRLEHVVIEYGGNHDWNTSRSKKANLNVRNDTVKLTMRDVLIRESDGLGLYVHSGNADITLEGSIAFASNAEGAANIRPAHMGMFSQTAAFADGAEVEVRQGDITNDQTWAACVPFVLADGINIRDDAVVTVEAGAQIAGRTEGHIDIYGGADFKAVGDATNRILFTGRDAAPGAWGGIRIEDTQSENNILAYVIIENAGGFDWNTSASKKANLNVQERTTLAIRNSVIRGSREYGIRVNSANATLTLANNRFEENGAAALDLPPNLVGSLAGSSAFGSEQNVRVRGGAVVDEQTWPACTPYLVSGMVSVEDDALLTIAPAVTLTFESEGGIDVENGSLNADGQTENKIIFTGKEKAPGAWSGIRYGSASLSTDNVLDQVVIEYGGGFDWNTSASVKANLNVQEEVRLRLGDAQIRDSGDVGIAFNSENITIDDCSNVTFSGNRTDVGGAYSTLRGACSGVSGSDAVDIAVDL